MKTIQVGQKVILRKSSIISSDEVSPDHTARTHTGQEEMILKEMGEFLSVVLDQNGLEWVVETNRLFPVENVYVKSTDAYRS